MGEGQDYERTYNEIVNFQKIIQECIGIKRTKSNYQGMSLEELSNLYDKVDGGLVGYNFVIEEDSPFFRKIIESSRKEDTPGRFLEAQLLNIALNMMIKDPFHNIPEKYKNSLWNDKLKDMEYFNKICDIAPIVPEHRKTLYDFLNLPL